MFSNWFAQALGRALLIFASGSILLFSQQPVAAPTPAERIELPVYMKQSVTAGKTPVGTKVQAELVVATMVNGVVVPRSATLSGEVTESVARTKTDSSRLAIRMDSVQWKNGSAPIKVYLTAWYYPEVETMNQNISYQPTDQTNSKGNWNGQGTYPDPNNPIAQQKFPGGRDSGKDSGPGVPTAAGISKHRTLMKNIESVRNTDGSVALTSDRINLKMDKLTTYVLATDDLLAK
jgi:hypothetical protein